MGASLKSTSLHADLAFGGLQEQPDSEIGHHSHRADTRSSSQEEKLQLFVMVRTLMDGLLMLLLLYYCARVVSARRTPKMNHSIYDIKYEDRRRTVHVSKKQCPYPFRTRRITTNCYGVSHQHPLPGRTVRKRQSVVCKGYIQQVTKVVER